MIEYTTGALRSTTRGRSASRSWYYGTKRLLDVTLVALASVVVLPLVLLLGIVIKFDSRGGMFYVQDRIRARRTKVAGEWRWNFEVFKFYKLRTMHNDGNVTLHRDYIEAYITDDESRMAEIQPGAKREGSYKLVGHPRVTGVGRVLRKLSLDELPQLWNVLRGDMSLVGPRPPIAYEFELYDDRRARRLASPPGVTGWWQVNGRAETTFQEMLNLDLEYIERQSIWFDLKILFMTVPAVLSGRGAG